MLLHILLGIGNGQLRCQFQVVADIPKLQVQVHQAHLQSLMGQLRRHINGNERLPHRIGRTEYGKYSTFPAFHGFPPDGLFSKRMSM